MRDDKMIVVKRSGSSNRFNGSTLNPVYFFCNAPSQTTSACTITGHRFCILLLVESNVSKTSQCHAHLHSPMEEDRENLPLVAGTPFFMLPRGTNYSPFCNLSGTLHYVANNYGQLV
jgi:hypothetical protein